MTAEELFFLGRAMNGPYIDYAYIAAMDDIQKSFAMHEQKNRLSLQNKGLLSEDFLGNILLSEESNCYRPVFFGSKEGRLEICGPAGEDKLIDLRLHFLDDSVTVTSLANKQLSLWFLNLDELSDVLERILNLSGSSGNAVDETFEIDDAFKVYVASVGFAEGNSAVKVWYEKDDALYEKTDSSVCRGVSPKKLLDSMVGLFKGGN